MGLEDVLNVGDIELVADLASILNGVASLQCRAQMSFSRSRRSNHSICCGPHSPVLAVTANAML